MVHKLKDKIITHLEEDMKEAEAGIKKDQELMEELKKLSQQPVAEVKKEEETDVMDDYTESMDEFIDSLDGAHKDEKKKTGEPEPEEIRALG
jgi:soluble cytochrome b562